MATASDAEIPSVFATTAADIPSYPANTFIRYYPTEGKDEHYTILQLKTGEVLQVKSVNKMVRKPLKFTNFQAWYDTLPGAPDIAAFKVAMGAGGATLDLSKASHLTPLPPMEDRYNDIYCWNRQIVKVLLEFAPDLLENPTFVENYNTIVETLKKYEDKSLILTGGSVYSGGLSRLLSKSEPRHGQIWFNCLQIRFDDYYRRPANLPPKEEIEIVKGLIGDALHKCIDVSEPRLESILKAKDELASVSLSLSHYRRISKNNKTKIERLVAHQLSLEKGVLKYEGEVEEAKKALSDLVGK
jgi:hypothetical protein